MHKVSFELSGSLSGWVPDFRYHFKLVMLQVAYKILYREFNFVGVTCAHLNRHTFYLSEKENVNNAVYIF